jgi:hypothetical protein
MELCTVWWSAHFSKLLTRRIVAGQVGGLVHTVWCLFIALESARAAAVYDRVLAIM